MLSDIGCSLISAQSVALE